jgi:hypothetical protein
MQNAGKITEFFLATHCYRAFCPMNERSCRFVDIENQHGVIFTQADSLFPTENFQQEPGLPAGM